MHTIDLLAEALTKAEQAGFEVRREYIEQSPGGACRVGEKWFLYVDPSLPVAEQLAQVVTALRARPS